MRHNRRDDGQLSCRKREMKMMNANTARNGHTTVIKMAERGGVSLIYLRVLSSSRASRHAKFVLHTLLHWSRAI